MLESLPSGLKQTLETCRVELVTTGLTLDVRVDLYGMVERLEELSGLYDRDRRQIILPERISTGDYDEDLSYLPQGVLRHELGHALDHCLAHISQTSPVYGVYLLGVDRAEQLGATRRLGYYLQSGPNGIREAFAEAVAVVLGGGAEPLHGELFADCFGALIERARKLVIGPRRGEGVGGAP